MYVVDLRWIVSIEWFVSQSVAFSMGNPTLDTAATQPVRKYKWIVISPLSTL